MVCGFCIGILLTGIPFVEVPDYVMAQKNLLLHIKAELERCRDDFGCLRTAFAEWWTRREARSDHSAQVFVDLSDYEVDGVLAAGQ